MCFYRTLDIVIYIVANYKICTRMYLRCVDIERWILLYILLLITKYVHYVFEVC